MLVNRNATGATTSPRILIARNGIVSFAENLVGTLYNMGCKDPKLPGDCHDRIDCSGLTSLAYDKSGIPLIRGKNAAQQYDFTLAITNPKWADLVFFKGSYDKNCDGLKDTADGVTHVAIFIATNLMVGAQSDGVDQYEISTWNWRYPKYCEEFVCKKKLNNECVEWNTCKCAVSWKEDKSLPIFDPFVGTGAILP